MTAPLLELRDICRDYPKSRQGLFAKPQFHRALDHINLTLQAGRSLGIVGESGSGKTTLARLIMALDQPTSGQVLLQGQDIHALPAAQLRALRPQFQMVFQNPYASLNPRMSVLQIVAEPLHPLQLSAEQQQQKVLDVLQAVGLNEEALVKYPHEFSGGQRQRIAIARAIVSQPQLVVADEPVSALDVSIQAQVLNVLRDLQRQRGISFVLISHDLAVVQHVCDDIAVLHQGQVVEYAPAPTLFAQPQHPYTQQLIAAVPQL